MSETISNFRNKYESASTLAPLRDLSFNTFITLSALKIVYVLIVLVETLALLLGLGGAFSHSVLTGLGGLILLPFLWLVAVILTRMYLELIAVVFRIAHNTTILARKAEGH